MKRHAKSYARIKAVKALYLSKLNPDGEINNINDALAIEIVDNIKKEELIINEYIKKNLKKWTINELNPVNLAILQVATLEIIENKTPTNIIISEALKIADEFCEVKDRRFIHFVLDNVNKEINVKV